MTAYDQARLAAELAALPQPAASSTAQGRKLQDLMEWLIAELPSVAVTLKNKVNNAKSEEKDLWFTHEPWVSRLPFADVLVPVECKNEATKTSAAEMREFGAKIAASGGSDGLLVSREGLSGSSGKAAHDVVHMELHAGRRIVVITAADLVGLTTTDDLVALVVARHTELRTEQTNVSI